MSYSSDLRKRVLDFVNAGSSKAEASRTYDVSRTCIYNWLDAKDPLSCQKPGPRGPHRIPDYTALKLAEDPETPHVADFPDQTQIERAAHFGVSKNCILYALRKLNITRKKRR